MHDCWLLNPNPHYCRVLSATSSRVPSAAVHGWQVPPIQHSEYPQVGKTNSVFTHHVISCQYIVARVMHMLTPSNVYAYDHDDDRTLFIRELTPVSISSISRCTASRVSLMPILVWSSISRALRASPWIEDYRDTIIWE